MISSDSNTSLLKSCFHVLLEYLLLDTIGKKAQWFMGIDSHK